MAYAAEMASYETKDGDRSKFEKVGAAKSVDKFDIFHDWLVRNGSKFPKLELKDYGNEVRGCHSTSDVGDDEIIIEVPLKCLITVEMGQDTDIGRQILASNIELDAPKHIFLMIFMLLDRRNPHSFFKPYYDILPPTLSNMPIFWSPKELSYLEGSYILAQIEERNVAIETDFSAICSIAPEFASVCTMDEFKWARMCVCSRNFGLVVNGLRTAALVPYADMLNHYRPRETKWQFDNILQGFTIVSMQGIAAGMQVYDSYGQKCNHRFLLNYGFSVENNTEPDGFCPNEVPLLLQLHQTDVLYEFKCSYFRREAYLPSKRVRICVAENENFHTLLCLLRIIEANQDDMNILTSLSGERGGRSIRDAHAPISVDNELRAMRLLLSTVRDCLALYPRTLEQDVERLLNDALLEPFSNERHAIIQVKGEKEVLHFLQELSETAINLLQVRDGAEFHSDIKAVQEQKPPVLYSYCRSLVALKNVEFGIEARGGIYGDDNSK